MCSSKPIDSIGGVGGQPHVFVAQLPLQRNPNFRKEWAADFDINSKLSTLSSGKVSPKAYSSINNRITIPDGSSYELHFGLITEAFSIRPLP